MRISRKMNKIICKLYLFLVIMDLMSICIERTTQRSQFLPPFWLLFHTLISKRHMHWKNKLNKFVDIKYVIHLFTFYPRKSIQVVCVCVCVLGGGGLNVNTCSMLSKGCKLMFLVSFMFSRKMRDPLFLKIICEEIVFLSLKFRVNFDLWNLAIFLWPLKMLSEREKRKMQKQEFNVVWPNNLRLQRKTSTTTTLLYDFYILQWLYNREL